MKHFASILFLLLFVLSFSIVTQTTLAETDTQVVKYESIVDLPSFGNQTNNEDGPTTETLIKTLYALSVSVAAFLALIKIIFGGVKYMLSDVITDKASAKKDIMGALLGLIIVIGAVLILNTINPNLTTISILKNAPGVGVFEDGEIGEPPILLQPGDSFRRCGGLSAQDCKTAICDPLRGTVTNRGVKIDETIFNEGSLTCIIRASDDPVINDGKYVLLDGISADTVYSVSEREKFIQTAKDNLIYIFGETFKDSLLKEAISVCKDNLGKSYIIKHDQGDDYLLCVNKPPETQTP